ncbi:tetratricopeptide repeat protein [Niallia sp. Krafla_26]|uniref:tetratricopeptide repeat protein n=1 Tax=Niallia sp. Krafla_26 TaxID=3064703 RepID=UPI003D16DBA2
MNKGQTVNKTKVIKFPGLENKLLEKGLEHLQAKNYQEAVRLLEQCVNLDPTNQEAYIGLLLAYFDCGLVEEAVALAHHMLQEDIGDELETLNIYLMLLVQRNEHERVVAEINQLMKESRIPFHKLEHFERLLHLSEKMLENQIDSEPMELDEESFSPLNLFQYQDPQEQIMIAAQLNNRPIEPYEKELKEYLQSQTGDSFFKTLLLNVLKEQQYDHPVLIEKFGKKMTMSPAQIIDLQENEQLSSLLNVIRERVADEDPILFENTKALIERHFFLMFPFPLEDLDIQAWGAAYHYTGNEYYGIHQSVDEMIDQYGTSYEDVEKALLFIKEFEELL